MNLRIEKCFILVVEGKDDQAVVELLLNHLNLNQVQVVNATSKDKIRATVTGITAADGFQDVVSGIAILRDADADPVAARQSCEACLRDIAKTTAFFVVPESGEGMLEDVCLQALVDRPEMQCVDDFLTCVAGNGPAISNKQKFRMKAFLMTHDEDTSQRIGWAAERGIIDPAHEAFAPLRDFLKTFTSS